LIAINIMNIKAAVPESATLSEAATVAAEVGAAVVVAADGRVLGLVTSRRLSSLPLKELAAMPAADCMEDDFIRVAPVMDFNAVKELVERSGADGVAVVVDDGGRHLGLITHGDMKRRLWEYREKSRAGKG